MFKIKYINVKFNKLIGVSSCEENIPKFTARFPKRQMKSATALSSESILMLINAKKIFLAKVFTD